MKIALLNGYNFHTECFGFIIHLLYNYIYINNNIITVIDIYTLNDKFKNILYFISLYNFPKNISLNIYPSSFFIEKRDNNKLDYNKYIKITSNDNILTSQNKEYKKCISICHLIKNTEINYKYISFIPIHNIEINPLIKISYIFPIYNGIKSNSYSNHITYIGYINNIDNDMNNFILKSGFIFNFITYVNITNKISKYKNINVYYNLDMFKTIEIINNSKFILTRKIPFQKLDRFSGSYSIAVSHCKPMIIQNKISNIYNLPGIKFENNYTEIINKIINMSDIEYNIHINNLNNFIDQNNSKNNKIFKELFI